MIGSNMPRAPSAESCAQAPIAGRLVIPCHHRASERLSLILRSMPFSRTYHISQNSEVSARLYKQNECCLPIGFAPIYHIEQTPKGFRHCLRIVPDPATAPLIVEAFRLVAQKRSSLRAVHRAMVERGLTAKNGTPISRISLYYVLRNPIYAGYKRMGLELRPTNLEPLINPELFDAAQEAFERRDARKRSNR